MKDKTIELLKQNRSLLDALSRVPRRAPLKPSKEDEVDAFFKKISPEGNPKSSDIITNESHDKAETFHNREALKDLDLLHTVSTELWKAKDNIAIHNSTMKLYRAFVRNGIVFNVNTDKYIAKGFSSFGFQQSHSKLLQSIVIPLDEPSILHDTSITYDMYYGPLLPSLWNNFLANKLIKGKVCPQIIALPVLHLKTWSSLQKNLQQKQSETIISQIILSFDLPTDYSEFKLICLKNFILQLQKCLEHLAADQMLIDL